FFHATGAALKRLQDAGFAILIVTNQSGVGRGYYTETEMHLVNAHVEQELAKDGVRVLKTYYATEAPDQPSRGRKPSPQFLFDARDEFGLDLAASYMIGDKLIDVECGWNAGVRKSILVRTGYGAKLAAQEPERLERAWIVNDLGEAAARILAPG
ncbi:MAG TPA: HAD-IIIA family hydrolase, partial [Verrucomicrobiae bacterium]|nr:HAD-IIIA family hydrolase [Verrucomicrobiae bacterium]